MQGAMNLLLGIDGLAVVNGGHNILSYRQGGAWGVSASI